MYGNSIHVASVAVTVAEIQGAIQGADAELALDTAKVEMRGLWQVTCHNYPTGKDGELLAVFRWLGSAMEAPQRIGPGVFRFFGGRQDLDNLVTRTVRRTTMPSPSVRGAMVWSRPRRPSFKDTLCTSVIATHFSTH